MRASLLTALATLASACSPDLHVDEAFAVVQPTGSGAAYFRIRNDGLGADVLLRVDSAAVRSAQLHEVVDEGGVAHMREVADGLRVGPRATVTFAPGGRHAMLFGVASDVAAIPLTLHFADSGAVTVVAERRP